MLEEAHARRSEVRPRTLLLGMGAVGLTAVLVSALVLYRAALGEQRARLLDLARSQARLIDAIARFDAIQSQDAHPAGAWVATLGQVASGFASLHAQRRDVSLFVLGRRGDRAVVYVDNGRVLAPAHAPLPGFPEELARLVTQGVAGTVEYDGPDHTTWLTATETIPSLDMAVVVRLDLNSLRRPLVHSAAVSGGAALLLIAMGFVLLRKTSVGLVDDLRRELSRRVRAEAALERHRDDLSRAVEERTEELRGAQEKLIAQERLATLGQITAKVSHELRNPLATIRTSLHTLRDAPAEVSQERVLSRMERSVLRCDRIIEELLTYTRLRPLRRESFDASQLLTELLDDYRPTAEVSLENLVQPGVELFADPEDVRRTVINLLNNAVDASQGGEHAGTVRIGLRREAENAVLSVEDNGQGMSPEVRARAFEPLFSTKGFGVGLGLPIVQELVQRNEGSVEVSSRPGLGTEVTVRLPLREEVRA
jgi:signal transduction histidine kinase